MVRVWSTSLGALLVLLTASAALAEAPQVTPRDHTTPHEAPAIATNGTAPVYGPDSLGRLEQAIAIFERAVAEAGWPMLPPATRGLKQGDRGPLVLALRERLVRSGDLEGASPDPSQFDARLADALRHFQARHGLTATGAVGRLTFAALNIPAEQRLQQLRASAERLRRNAFRFGPRHVIVNIPGATVEAVAHGRVERRYRAVVGRRDRPSPVIAARITQITVNPSWTVPASIIEKDIVPAVARDPEYLFKNNLRTLNWKGEEVDPNTLDWSGRRKPAFMVRQDPGPTNALGLLKIDMPNVEAVYLHDTPKQELFRADQRFHSSGCVRVQDVRDFATWLLQDSGIDRASLDAAIAGGARQDLRLRHPVPVAWVYLTAWVDGDGVIQFRDDIYGLDTPEGLRISTLDGQRRTPTPADPLATASTTVRKARTAPQADTIATSTARRTRRETAAVLDQPLPPPIAAR